MLLEHKLVLIFILIQSDDSLLFSLLQQFRMKQIILIILLSFCIQFGNSQEEQSKAKQIFLSLQKTYKLTGPSPLVGHYQLSISQKDIPKYQDKWYLFAMAQPKTQNTSLLGTPTKIQIRRVDTTGGAKLIKSCNMVQQTDACFIKNNEFDYKTEKIHYRVYCEQQCEFGFVTQIDYAYPLQMNKPFKLNFQNTAYSKIFTLSTEGYDFYELRILLLPRGFIKYGQPIVMFANYGTEVPTREKHDFQGIHTWDDGQGIFIRKSQMKNRTLTILIEGPQKNILTLNAKSYQKQQKLELQQYWPEFDVLKAGESRQFLAQITKNVTHRVKVVTFSGAIEATKIFKIQGSSQVPLNFATPSQKYGQFEYRLSKDLIQKQRISKFLIKVTVRKQTTYLVNYAREEQQISLLFPYISETSFMEPKQIDQYYFKVEQLIETARDKKSSKIEIIIGNIQGNVSPKFYRCNATKKAGVDNIKDCQYSSSNKQDFTQAIPQKYQNRGGEKRYWFDIEWLDYIKRTEKDKIEIVYQMTVVIENINEDKTSSYEIQYKNKDRIYLLRQGQTIKDRVFIDEKRHYKLSIQDSDAIQVRMHCTKISGEIIFFGSREDPREKKDHQKILPIYGIVTYKLNNEKKLNQVYLQVQGVDNALYSITTQIIRKSQSNPTKKNGTGYNELIVQQEIPYQFVISPQDSIVLQLHLTQSFFTIHLRASSALQICMTQNLDNPPYPPNCQIKKDSVLQLDQRLYMQKSMVGNIGLKNSNNNNVTVKVRLAKAAKENETYCEFGYMNQVMWRRAGSPNQTGDRKRDHNEDMHCIQFDINRYTQIQLIVDVRDETSYTDGRITASINGQQVVKIMSPSHIFTKQQVESACKPNNYDKDVSFCYMKVTLQKIYDTRIRVLVQYTDSAIRLIDGLAHPVHANMKKSEPKNFYMGIHNFENITVFLQNKIGEYKIYASLMKYHDFQQQKIKKNTTIFPTKQSKDLESSNPFYYMEQIITVSSEKIKQKCPETTYRVACVLLLSVILDGSNDILKSGKFVIEATQQNRELKDGAPLNGFLQKKSVMFYHYQNTIPNGTLIINVNNQNKNCIDIYVREGSERASASNNEKHTKSTNTLLVPKAINGTYSITLQANQNCQYTVEVTSTKNSLNRIKKGTFKDVNLVKDETIYLLFENEINETFKVLSSHKSGQVIISVNPILRAELEEVLTGDMGRIKDWTWTNKDSVRINNVDRQGKLQQNYCVDCYYLIKITAQRPTEASIIIPTPDSELPITTDSLIKDILLKGEVTTFRVFTQSSSQFQTYVQYGKIKISIFEAEKNTSVFEKTFSQSKAPVVQNFNLSKTESYQFLRYSKVKIQALEQSYFSFAIISNPDPNRRGLGLKYGIPQYIFLQSGKQKCVLGSMVLSQDQFLLSFSRNDKVNIQGLNIRIKIDQKEASFDKQVGNNQMLISINPLATPASATSKFNFCMQSKQPLSVTVIQSSPVNYWPQKESVVVRKQLNMTFGSEGKNIIEINQCRSRAVTQIFSEFNNIKTAKSQIKQRRRNNNIVEFYYYGAVYIHLKSDKATMRWFPVNQTSGAGQGYDDYQTSWIRVIKNGSQIEVTAEPLKQSTEKDVKSKLQSATYSFFAAREQMELYGAMNCMQGQFVKKIVPLDIVSKNDSKSLAKTSFNIQTQLLPKFGKQNYFLIGLKAQVYLKNPEGVLESYRFYYPYQQVNKEMLTNEYDKPKPINPIVDQQDQYGISWLSIFGYMFLGLIILILLYCVYVKYLRKHFYKRQSLGESTDMEMKYTGFTSGRR